MRHLRLCIVSLILLALPVTSHAQPTLAPIGSDQRIRTLVYNPNEVYPLTTYYGFQSNIVFAEDEQITTISLGNQSSFNLVPVKNYLFIRPITMNGRTNMTVLTNKRSYQFDLISQRPNPNQNIAAYVTKFFYPTANDSYSNAFPPAAPTMPIMESMQQPTPTMESAAPTMPYPQYNFNYSISGDDAIAPQQVFDDGSRTYFSFSSPVQPQVFIVGADGQEQPTPLDQMNGYWSTPTIAGRFALRQGNELVCVFKESTSMEQ